MLPFTQLIQIKIQILQEAQFIIFLISTNLVNSAFADVQINRPGLIPPGLLICDELICKILPDDRDTPAQIISYDPQVGVTIIIKKGSSGFCVGRFCLIS